MRDSKRIYLYGGMLWGLVLAMALMLIAPTILGWVATPAAAEEEGDTVTIETDNLSDEELEALNESDEYTVENGTVTIEGDGVSAEVDDEYAWDLDVSLDGFDVGFETGGGNSSWANITMESDAIDSGVEQDATTGLCVVGLNADESPVDMGVDGDEGTANATVTADAPDDGYSAQYESSTASEVVEQCRSR